MKFIAEIKSSEKFEIEGKKFVKLQGFINGLGLFQQTVREEIVPDSLEGKECELGFEVGLVNFKPTLKLTSLKVIENDEIII